jgi:putative transposase
MNTRKFAAEYRLGKWAQTIQERTVSGESIKKFCQSRGISRNTYFYWQRKLRAQACRELLPVLANEKAVIPSGWAVCETAKTERSESGINIEIGQCRVAVGSEFSPEVLEGVCRVLVSLC